MRLVVAHTGRVLRVSNNTPSPPIKFIRDLHTDLFLDEKDMMYFHSHSIISWPRNALHLHVKKNFAARHTVSQPVKNLRY